MNGINIIEYTDTIRRYYGDHLIAYQLIHEDVEVHLYIVYSTDNKIDLVRVFPNYFANVIDISIEHRLGDLNFSQVAITDLMQLVETLVNTIKGEI